MRPNILNTLFGAIVRSSETRTSLVVRLGRIAFLTSFLVVLVSSVQSFQDKPGQTDFQSPVSGVFDVPLVQAAELRDAGRTTVDKGHNLIAPGDLALALPFHFRGSATDRSRAVDCLAMAAWYEAGDSPKEERSVIQVVLNRLRHPTYPNSICAIVFEGSQRSTGCQFTFTCDGSLARRSPSAAAMARARRLANRALDGWVEPSAMQATHYHANYVAPKWRAELVQINRVGQHIFYRWSGRRGALVGKPHYGSEISVAELGNRGDSSHGSKHGRVLEAGARVEVTEGGLGSGSKNVGTIPIFLEVDGSAPNGRWAIAALEKCAGSAGCQVFGYENRLQIDRNRSLSPSARDRPIFMLLRDAASGMTLSLWDCRKVNRPNQKQCLPEMQAALDKLMRERVS